MGALDLTGRVNNFLGTYFLTSMPCSVAFMTPRRLAAASGRLRSPRADERDALFERGFGIAEKS